MLCVLALECSLLAGYHSWKQEAENNDLNGGGSEGEKRRNVGGGWWVDLGDGEVDGGWILWTFVDL